MIVAFPVLEDLECAVITARLESLRSLWIQRGSGFATFGVAAYLDVMNSEQPEIAYYERRLIWNELLRSEFGDLLQRVATVLARGFGVETRFESAVALPGFHIFENEGISISAWPSQHFDLQHRSLRWPFQVADEGLLSFTLPLKIPSDGAGLDVWNVTEDDFKRYERMGRTVDMEILGKTKPCHRHHYVPGVMAVQTRPIMHRISPNRTRLPGDQRITLQGHAVRHDNRLVLYW